MEALLTSIFVSPESCRTISTGSRGTTDRSRARRQSYGYSIRTGPRRDAWPGMRHLRRRPDPAPGETIPAMLAHCRNTLFWIKEPRLRAVTANVPAGMKQLRSRPTGGLWFTRDHWVWF